MIPKVAETGQPFKVLHAECTGVSLEVHKLWKQHLLLF